MRESARDFIIRMGRDGSVSGGNLFGLIISIEAREKELQQEIVAKASKEAKKFLQRFWPMGNDTQYTKLLDAFEKELLNAELYSK